MKLKKGVYDYSNISYKLNMIVLSRNIPKNILRQMIENEKSEILSNKQIICNLKKSILLYIEKLTNTIEQNINPNSSKKLIELLSNLKESLDKLSNLEKNIGELLDKLNYLSLDNRRLNSKIKKYNNTFIDFKKNWITFFEEYNILFDNIINTINSMFLNDSINTDNQSSSLPDTTNSAKIPELETNLSDNKCLLISQIQNKVFLPYTINQLNKQLIHSSKKYNNIEEIINNEYIVPIDRFKNPIVSRFKETYNLMKFKEHASTLSTLDLALELSFNFTLNPAVIAACENKDQLDIYLACLYDNELDKFHLFEIKYEIPPIVKK